MISSVIMAFEITGTATCDERVYILIIHIHGECAALLHKEERWNRRLRAGVACDHFLPKLRETLYCLHISVWTEEAARAQRERKIALRRTGAEKSLHTCLRMSFLLLRASPQ